MKSFVLLDHIQQVISKACELKDEYTDQKKAAVNYACLFSQSDLEYKDLLDLASVLGEVIEKTPTGPIYRIKSFPTEAGPLQLVKVRKPDSSRKELGDADFTVDDYTKFKAKYLDQPRFKLIERENFEMMELSDPSSEVLAYFSHPTQEELLGVSQADNRRQ